MVQPEPLSVPVAAPRPRLNPNQRVQAMRMVFLNENVSILAATLAVARQEVDGWSERKRFAAMRSRAPAGKLK